VEKNAVGQEKSTLMPRGPLRKEAFRTLLCGHLIPDFAGIALDYFWVLMFVRIQLALSFLASVEGLVVYGVILGSRTMDVLLTFLQKSKIIFACNY
jgi:hypothetical protein